MPKQIRLSLISNAGGTGKTTLAVHTAFGLAQRGINVTILELDPSGSLKRFVGLAPVEEGRSMAEVFKKDFKGDYPFISVWTDYTQRVKVVQGGRPLEESVRTIISILPRKHLCLMDCLEDFEIDSDVIIIDTPASLEPMGLVALAASTHILVPLKPEYKDTDGAAEFISWYDDSVRSLRLKPKPKIIGFVPTRVDLANFAAHRNILGVEPVKGGKSQEGKARGAKVQRKKNIDQAETLPYQIEQMGFYCFPMIRESSDFVNASGVGLPLQIYRPGSDASKNFEPLIDRVIQLLKEE